MSGDVAALKQACLDLSKEALAFYDRLEEHGDDEAVLQGDGAATALRLGRAWTVVHDFIATQAARHLTLLLRGQL